MKATGFKEGVTAMACVALLVLAVTLLSWSAPGPDEAHIAEIMEFHVAALE